MSPQTAYPSPAAFTFIALALFQVFAAARQVAKAFFEQIKQENPNEDWVVTFDWAISRRVWKPAGGDWQDLGAGLDVAAYRRRQISANAIQELDGLEFAFKTPKDVFDPSERKLIEIDPSDNAPVRLV